MLRLPPTTLSLTMAEVKDFEQRRRFKKYLSKNKTFVNQLPLAPRIAGSPDRSGGGGGGYSSDLHEADPQNRELQQSQDIHPALLSDEKETPKSISRPATQQRFKGGDSVKGSSKSNSHSNSSQTVESRSSSRLQESTLGGRPAALPPPFSMETRTVSDSQSLPSAEAPSNPRAAQHNPVFQRPSTPPPRRSSLRSYHTADDAHASPSTTHGRSRIFSSAVRFVGSVIRSPTTGWSGSSPPSSSPYRTRRSVSASPTPRAAVTDATATPRLTVYNDAVAASLQPQTPSNLPEARHQSRVRQQQGSYTAPVARVTTRSAYRSATAANLQSGLDSSNEHDHMSTGMDTPGFRGLYGGIENSEDSTLFEESSIITGRN